MNTTTIKFVGSLRQANDYFEHGYPERGCGIRECKGYKRISGNYKRGTYLLEVQEK